MVKELVKEDVQQAKEKTVGLKAALAAAQEEEQAAQFKLTALVTELQEAKMKKSKEGVYKKQTTKGGRSMAATAMNMDIPKPASSSFAGTWPLATQPQTIRAGIAMVMARPKTLPAVSTDWPTISTR